MEVDLHKGQVVNEITPQTGSHFYGHGVVSNKHNVLITTENSYSSGEGRIVLRDKNNYKILGSYASGGVGPHQLAVMPNSDTLVVANGGIKTHPDHPRKKLNLEVMKPNLAYIDLVSGNVIDSYQLDNHQLSIRHLAVSDKGKVVAGLQYQGAKNDLVPLACSHHGQDKLQYLSANESTWRAMNQYTASVAIDNAKKVAVISCPRANMLTYWSLEDDSFITSEKLADGAGLTFTDQIFASSGKGRLTTSKVLNTQGNQSFEHDALKWDNHLNHIKIA